MMFNTEWKTNECDIISCMVKKIFKIINYIKIRFLILRYFFFIYMFTEEKNIRLKKVDFKFQTNVCQEDFIFEYYKNCRWFSPTWCLMHSKKHVFWLMFFLKHLCVYRSPVPAGSTLPSWYPTRPGEAVRYFRISLNGGMSNLSFRSKVSNHAQIFRRRTVHRKKKC